MSVEFTAWRDAVVKKLRRVISLAESIGDGEPENHHTLFTRQFIAVEIKDLGELVSAVPGCLEFDAMVGFLRLDEFCKRLQIDRNPETGGYSFPREALNLFVGELTSPVGLTSLKKIALLLEGAETGNDTGESANGTGPAEPPDLVTLDQAAAPTHRDDRQAASPDVTKLPGHVKTPKAQARPAAPWPEEENKVAACPVVLKARTDRPLVRGKGVACLNQAGFNVIKALLIVWPERLSKDELVKKSGHKDAVGILTRLSKHKKRTEWASVIELAKERCMGYGIARS